MELALGPLLFEWKKEEVLRFYEEVAETPVERVYLGEVVCSKKKVFTPDVVAKVAERLTAAGKKVTLSSLAVISNEEELAFTRELLKLPYPVEANDMAVFNMEDPSRREVFAGPHITTYNAPSIEFLKGLGVKRVSFPVELSRESVEYNIKNTGIAAEVFSHGKVPLAFSWRCYTSRAFGLTKTHCRHHCANYPDGMEVKSLEGEPLFTINGTSVLSTGVYTLAEFVEDLKEIGVKALRVSPHHVSAKEVIGVFRKRLDGLMSGDEALRELRGLHPQGLCNGWYMGEAGRAYIEGSFLKS